MVIDMDIFKSNQITIFFCVTIIPKTDMGPSKTSMGLPKTGVTLYVVGLN